MQRCWETIKETWTTRENLQEHNDLREIISTYFLKYNKHDILFVVFSISEQRMWKS